MTAYTYVGQTTDADGDPVRVMHSDGRVTVDSILHPERTVTEWDIRPDEARDLADLLIRAAYEAES